MSGNTWELVGSIADGEKGDVRIWVDSHNYKKLDKARVDMMDRVRELGDSISVFDFDLGFDLRPGLCFATSDPGFCFDRGLKCTRLW